MYIIKMESVATVNFRGYDMTTVRERQIRGDRQGNFQLDEDERGDILCRFKYFIGSFEMYGLEGERSGGGGGTRVHTGMG